MSDSLKVAIVYAGLVATLALMPATCVVEKSQAEKVLHTAGYDEVVVGEYAWFECGSDSYSVTFRATNQLGDRVLGVVCCNFGDACNVRLK
jgi:hypothetical protein